MIELYNGDCYELIKTIPDNSVDLIVTDPPYNFGSKGGGFYADNKSTQRKYCDALMKLNCCDFIPKDFLFLLKSKLKKFYGYFFCNKTLITDYIDFAKQNKYNFDVLVMCKSNPIPAYNNHYMSDLEYIIVIRETGTYFSKEKNIELYRKWFITNCKKGVHPAEKPLDLIKKFVTVGSETNQLVLDPFMGSGTTGVACKELGRSFIGIELDKNYFEIAKQRISELGDEDQDFLIKPCRQLELF